LAQGMPNCPPPRELLEAAHRAIEGDFHQYAITWGAPSLRRAIADKYAKVYGMDVDPERNVTVCCGSTETMLSTLLAVLNPGDEVIVFEPFYENYGPGCIIAGAEPVFVPLEPPDFGSDPDRLARAVSPRTRAIAPAGLSDGIRRAHDFVTVGAPHPLQEAAVAAFALPGAYYARLRAEYQARRDLLYGYIEKAGFVAWKPRGAYYILTDVTHFL